MTIIFQDIISLIKSLFTSEIIVFPVAGIVLLSFAVLLYSIIKGRG